MEKYEIQKLRELPIEGVAERLGLTVVRHKCLCPFHEDHTPSLSFRSSTNTYRCFVCGAHGDSIDLARKVLNKSFPDACKWLADEHNVILTEYQSKPKPKMETPVTFDRELFEFIIREARLGCYAKEFLFDIRHLDPSVIKKLHIGAINESGIWFLNVMRKRFSEDRLRKAGLLIGPEYNKHCYFATPCLLFPYYDVDGNLIAVQSRYIGNLLRFMTTEMQEQHDAKVKRTPRFQFTRGSHPSIFNIPVLRTLQPGEELWITEGVTDCLAMLSAGRKAIAIPSATLLTPHNCEVISNTLLSTLATNLSSLSLHIYPDKDDAGTRLYNELVKLSLSLGVSLVRHDLPQGCKDFADYYVKNTPNYSNPFQTSPNHSKPFNPFLTTPNHEFSSNS